MNGSGSEGSLRLESQNKPRALRKEGTGTFRGGAQHISKGLSSRASSLYFPAKGGLTAKESLEMLESDIQVARQEGRWLDSSRLLEKWVEASREYMQSELAPETKSTSRMTGVTRARMNTPTTPTAFFGKAALGVQKEEDNGKRSEAITALIPKLIKMLEKEAAKLKQAHQEELLYVSLVNKQNEHGKVQSRLLVITNGALYNAMPDGSKSKRRVPLDLIEGITTDGQGKQFVVHIPSEYDYLFSMTGESLSMNAANDDRQSPTGIIEAVQAAHSQHLARLARESCMVDYSQAPLRVSIHMESNGNLSSVMTTKSGSGYQKDHSPAGISRRETADSFHT